MYKASCFVASQLSQLSHVCPTSSGCRGVRLTVSRFACTDAAFASPYHASRAQMRRSPHRITLRVHGCGVRLTVSRFVCTDAAHCPRIFAFSRCYRIVPCSYMLASFKHAVLCACIACPKTACLTTTLYIKSDLPHICIYI